MDWLLNPHNCPGFLRSEKKARTVNGAQTAHTETLWFKIPKRYALINITEKIEDIVSRSEIEDGLCYVTAQHITAGIYVNDAESGLLDDISKWIESLAPFDPKGYAHHQTGEDNADAHLKSFLTNHFVVLPVTGGRLDLGTWQQVFYAEYDGKREKRVLVKVCGISRGN